MTVPFGTDPGWLVLLKSLAIFVFLLVAVIFTIWLERRVVARMQMRLGPNRVGPFGLLQGLVDGVKIALKQDIIPKAADRPVFLLAPLIAAIPAFLTMAVIPFGPAVSIFGTWTNLQLTDFSVSVLYILAVASVGIYGIVLAGWASGSTYPLLGGLRSSAQMISYEIAMGLSLVAVFLFASSMQTSTIVAAQQQVWYALLLAPSFIIYVTAMVGETNRAPFDLPEAEGELVAGFHTEYTSLKFAMFFLAEYINMFTVSALATTLFLGGWRAPWPITQFWDGANSGWWPLLWWTAKVFAFIFMFIWLRGTLPRLRYDQFMKFGWKVLIPLSLVWILFVSGIRAARTEVSVDLTYFLLGGALVVGAILVLLFVLDQQLAAREAAAADDAEREARDAVFDPMAGGHPVPPMPGQQLPPIPAAAAVTSGSTGSDAETTS